MKNLRTMLKEEMAKSSQFTEENFGLRVGDTFKEMCLDVLRSDTVSALLLKQVNIIGSNVPSIGKSMMEVAKNSTEEVAQLQKVILKNMSAFEMYLAMLYWGMNIGRQLAAEESAMILQLADSVKIDSDNPTAEELKEQLEKDITEAFNKKNKK